MLTTFYNNRQPLPFKNVNVVIIYNLAKIFSTILKHIGI